MTKNDTGAELIFSGSKNLGGGTDLIFEGDFAKERLRNPSHGDKWQEAGTEEEVLGFGVSRNCRTKLARAGNLAECLVPSGTANIGRALPGFGTKDRNGIPRGKAKSRITGQDPSAIDELRLLNNALRRHCSQFVELLRNDQSLVDRLPRFGWASPVQDTLQLIELSESAEAARRDATTRLSGLSGRERQVMENVLAGHPSKNIATDLGISQRTVEKHRASVMRKTGLKSLPALVRLAFLASG